MEAVAKVERSVLPPVSCDLTALAEEGSLNLTEMAEDGLLVLAVDLLVPEAEVLLPDVLTFFLLSALVLTVALVLLLAGIVGFFMPLDFKALEVLPFKHKFERTEAGFFSLLGDG